MSIDNVLINGYLPGVTVAEFCPLTIKFRIGIIGNMYYTYSRTAIHSIELLKYSVLLFEIDF